MNPYQLRDMAALSKIKVAEARQARLDLAAALYMGGRNLGGNYTAQAECAYNAAEELERERARRRNAAEAKRLEEAKT